MASSPSESRHQILGARVRKRLVEEASQALSPLSERIQQRLTELVDQAASAREMQLRRDGWTLFQRHQTLWCEGTRRTWQAALQSTTSRAAPLSLGAGLQLVGTDVVENRIIASRLALGVMEQAASEVNDFRKRLKSLQADQVLSSNDIAHPETLTLPLIEQWVDCGLLREHWFLVHDTVVRFLGDQLKQIYARCNAGLIEQGILPVIDFASPPRQRSPSEPMQSSAHVPVASQTEQQKQQQKQMQQASGTGVLASAYQGIVGTRASALHPAYDAVVQSPRGRAGRVRGLMDRIGRLIVGPVPTSVPTSEPRRGLVNHIVYQAPSASLLQVIDEQPLLDSPDDEEGQFDMQHAPVLIERVATGMRQQTTKLKAQAKSDSEKAIIELVALMFQSILQEDRIPTGVRVWFARLQMPVLRIALAEPDFFSRLDHPARQLIDRMGSCVMGFDASGMTSAALETEIKRIVQVIEQYPETGEVVYQRVYEEFQNFLKQHLTQKASTLKVVGVALQVEQKETLSIQYTIELRNQIQGMPVRDEIREFVYKVWADVLAVSTIRQGAQHQETLLLKKTAADLIWAASAKPNRSDRARVIADLPNLLKCLRLGMGLLGVVKTEQESHIKVISDTLADAFMSKTKTIAIEQVQALAERLVHLEDYVSDDGTEELPINAQNIEELIDMDASELDVITSGGVNNVSKEILEWARGLDVGAWFILDHNAQVAQVQYAWRSPLGHLHLFASRLGHSYLIQSMRLAAYLQAGLLRAQEDESLTVRATRDALGKLEANPERLLA
jgi:hypothetical protein